ncbi:alpha/beta hydrolase [Fructilactobacillus myrtifloralis]|uniref:Alpha/beta hydrolase n=1 Tax=Fructilactobacillus myrtifloralis TaxID=2940301 RepID=A0ABY5BPB7_9LACO|nr:alpha/beta hydrolase [Fructilactobacillus myrtifloralis]USS84801.1 alpha/beta hydrolase [Fructilactobacillus myrtifloralis]
MPIIFLHGYELDGTSLMPLTEPVFKKLLFGYQRIYIDLPGMGRSRELEFIDAKTTLQELVQTLRALNLSRFLVVGQSYGGYLATGLKKDFPHAMKAQLLVVPMVVPKLAERTLDNLAHPYVGSNSDQFTDDFKAVNVILNHLKFALYQRLIEKPLAYNQSTNLTRVMNSDLYSLPNWLNAIEPVATMLLVGRYDNIVGHKDPVKLLTLKYPELGIKQYGNSGHNLMIDETDRFTADLVQFVTKYSGFSTS